MGIRNPYNLYEFSRILFTTTWRIALKMALSVPRSGLASMLKEGARVCRMSEEMSGFCRISLPVFPSSLTD